MSEEDTPPPDKDQKPLQVEEQDEPKPKEKAPGREPSGRLSKVEPGISKMFEMALGFTSGGPAFHPLFEKFNDEHINKFLDGIQADDNNAYRLQSTNRIYHLLYTLVGVGVLIFLFVWLLPENKDLLIDILRIFVIFAGGLGAGFGLKSHLEKKR